MALRQLMINKKLEQKRAALKELQKKEEEFTTRSAELEQSIEEATTDEEVEAVESSIEELEKEKEELENEKKDLEGTITDLEGELEDYEDKTPVNDERSKHKPHSNKGETRMKVNNYETRSQMLERLDIEEVREFYTTLANAAKDSRSLSGTDVLIPETVVNMIQTRLGDYSTLYKEVTVQQLNGTARIIMDGAIPEAIWTEMCDPVQELATSFSQTELDGFKVGGFIPVCNATIEDSMIVLANFVEERLAMAIAKSLDKAILVGEGVTQKQPTGIITAVQADPDGNNVTSDGSLKDIVGKKSLIDDGEDGSPIGEVIAVMKRSFYYSEIAPQTFLATSGGQYVIQTANSPRLPDGTRIVFNQYAPDNTIVLGDYKKYLLGERAGVNLSVSTDVRFIQDQTVFKGTARYDGKPVYNNKFVVITVQSGGANG